MLAWGKKDEVERVSVYNEETGEHTFTGEVLETDWCSYESGVYVGALDESRLDSEVFAGAVRVPSLAELREIYNGIELSEERQVSLLKTKLKEEIGRYDKSTAVEDFSIGGVHLWLDSNLRTKVRENLETAQQKGEENVTLRYEGMAFPMTVEMGWQLYYAVLDYARATWDVTQIHLSEVDSLASVEELLAYDYKGGYPEKLAF